MRFYKQILSGFIVAIGTNIGGTGITETEYNEILSIIHNKPPATNTVDYRLREDLTWEEYEIDHPDSDPEIEDAEVYETQYADGTPIT